MRTPDPALIEHTDRMLVGTDVSTETAADVASGHLPCPGSVAAALRDGWASADRAGSVETLGQQS